MTKKLWQIIVLAGITLAACSETSMQNGDWRFWQSPTTGKYMVATAHPHATQAGIEILEKGGNAVDAAIAVQMALNVVEPESSGIGGGSFILFWDDASGELKVYDGREMATAATDASVFDTAPGQSFVHRVFGGTFVAVPGTVAALEKAHSEHGKLPWQDLFGPAIELAENGFEVSPKLHHWLSLLPTVQLVPDIQDLYTDNGVPYSVGTVITNTALAESLRTLADGGPDAFYEGSLTHEIVDTVSNASLNPAPITAEDFAAYQAKLRDPVCGPYRKWTICSMPPPSSGGTTVLQIMSLLEGHDLASLDPGSAPAVHLISEASRIAYADRERYVGDPDFDDVPTLALIDADYIAKRAQLINKEKFGGKAEAGNPNGEATLQRADGRAMELPSTSHLSIIDGKGNALSMTTSVGYAFGSNLLSGGFFLNNHVTDFSSTSEVDGRLVVNRVESGKRPRSSMSPTIVFDENDELYLLIGTSGGGRIIGHVAKVLIGVLDWDLDIQSAIDLPNFNNLNGATSIEEVDGSDALKAALEALGHEVNVRGLRSGLQGIKVTDTGLEGGADPRRAGTAEGN